MRDGWEAEAAKWAAFAGTPGHDHSHEDINLPALRALLPAPGRRTLDLACGEGRLSRYLRSIGHQVTGADAAPTMVRMAAGHQDAPPAVVADAAALPFRDGAFDLVVAYMCLHDMDQMPRAVAEAARVLERGGRLCAAIPHPVNSAGDFQGRGADAPFGDRGLVPGCRPGRLGTRPGRHHDHFPQRAPPARGLQPGAGGRGPADRGDQGAPGAGRGDRGRPAPPALAADPDVPAPARGKAVKR